MFATRYTVERIHNNGLIASLDVPVEEIRDCLGSFVHGYTTMGSVEINGNTMKAYDKDGNFLTSLTWKRQ